eukprot:scaffold991_cov128-Cylindrotheca_fusiformis.AAC.37
MGGIVCLSLYFLCLLSVGLLQSTNKASAFQFAISQFSSKRTSRTRRRGRENEAATMDMDGEWIVRSLDGTAAESVPSCPGSDKKGSLTTRLVLHLDINETILLGDDAGGDTRHDSLQKMIAKSAFCQLPDKDSSATSWEDTQKVKPTHWWDGQVMGQETSMPPLYTGWTWPPGCCPYYRTGYKDLSKQFVERHHGKIYSPILDECEKILARDSDGVSHLLPAFYQTLRYLIKLHDEEYTETNNVPVTLVFRTFGSDIDDIANHVTKFAQEVKCPWLELPPKKLFRGKWKELDDGSVTYQLWNQAMTEVVANGDGEILKLLDSGSVFGIRDDYDYWDANECYPTAGKPVWIPQYQKQGSHHLFFDDNIHNLTDDGIACLRKQEVSSDQSFVTVDAAAMHEESQGVHLIRVPTIEPVLNSNWFVEKIQVARTLMQKRIESLQ